MKKIAFILYPGITALDLFGVVDPLVRLKTGGAVPDLEWDFCAFHPEISDSNGIKIMPTRSLQPLYPYDLVVIPGGPGSRAVIHEPEFLHWIQTVSDNCLLASVCTGALVLGAAGFLEGKRAATHPSARSLLEELGNIRVVPARVVEDGRVITSGGVTAGIDLGLFLAQKAAGITAAQAIRQQMDYPYVLPPSSQLAPRNSQVRRETRETSVEIRINLDGSGKANIHTGLPFFDHMLTQLAVHGLFDVDISAQGDLEIDPHHTVEDVGLTLGAAFAEALGNRQGINRMASAFCPMDESLAQVVVDFSGRPYCMVQVNWNTPQTGGIPTSLFPHFFESLAIQARCNLHIAVPYGRDDHHQVEAVFKALARAMYSATRIDPARAAQIPSSKGTL